MAAALLWAYFGTLAVLAAVGVYRLGLVWVAWRAKTPVLPPLTDAPPVLVQLPLYNERFVAERLIRAVAALRYPNPLRIQILDDSTDDTRQVVARLAESLGLQVVRRAERSGYKAGALAHGLSLSDEPLVAIFDADFVPEPDFLERLVPVLLQNPKHGMVQARWGHLNREQSWLTRAQAIFLDGHFRVEHQARAALGCFFNFNGTAGIWRREAILAAGGWRDLTLTEDLDLSYRAQLAGWRFVYVDQVVAPAELPESWAAFRAQQARWVRGSVETARLLLGSVLRAALPFPKRMDAAVHLSLNFAYLLMALLALLLPLAVIVRDQLGWRVPGGQSLLSIWDLSTLGAGTVATVLFYLAAARRPLRILDVVMALCVGAGMSLSNAREVLIGLWSARGEFVRTPKKGGGAGGYRSPMAWGRTALELLAASYHGAALIYALDARLWGAVPFLALYVCGFGWVGLGSLKEAWAGASPAPALVESEGR